MLSLLCGEACFPKSAYLWSVLLVVIGENASQTLKVIPVTVYNTPAVDSIWLVLSCLLTGARCGVSLPTTRDRRRGEGADPAAATALPGAHQVPLPCWLAHHGRPGTKVSPLTSHRLNK